MECEAVRAHFADCLSTPPEAWDPEVGAHLRTCDTCARELEELRATWHLLDGVPAERPDSAAMRARFDAALAEAAHTESRSRRSPSPAFAPADGRRVNTRLFVQFGSAAAVLLLGVLLGRQTLPPDADRQIAALHQEVQDMRQLLMLSLMRQQSASERLKGVTSTGQIERPGGEVMTALLDTLMHDPNVNVRLASIDALRRFADRDGVRRGAVEAVPRQTSPLVQIALIDFLAEVAGPESTNTLRSLSQDPMLDRAVRERAARVLKQVS
jgi:hypothetical protein